MQVIGSRAYCLDLGSRSALAWNGRSRRSGWIEPGQFVEIGPYRIGLPALAPTFATHNPSDTSSPALATDLRVLLEPNGQGRPAQRDYEINRLFTLVGRAPECDLRLSDLSVSRYHCLLIRLGHELWVVDLLGRGGVEVDDRPVPWTRLDDASLLRIGRDRFTVRLVSSNSRPIPEASCLPFTPPRSNGSSPPSHPPEPLAELPALIERPALPVPTNVSLPVSVERPEHAELTRLAESMIAPLIDQFNAMQQHLFDQYHQSMMEMMAVFARLHHEQQGLVDREMRKIRRLTREVRALRRELDQQRKAAATATPAQLGIKQTVDSKPIDPGRPAEAPGPSEDYREAQARIIARMTALQQERQGRWQRLLGRLGAGSVEQDR